MNHGRWVTLMLLSALLSAPAGAAQPPDKPKPSPDPGEKPVTQREVDELRRQITQETRSSLELLLDVHGENGDLNNKLGFVRYGARLNLMRSPGTSVYLRALRTPYQTRDGAFQSSATGVTAGLRSRLSDRREWEAELSATRFSAGDWGLSGFASLTFRPQDALRYSVALQRTNVEESLLSVAGLHPTQGPFAGMRVGGVYDTRLTVTGAYRLPARFDVFGEASVGSRAGSEVDGNFFRRAGGGLGFVAVARAEDHVLSLLRLSLSVDYFGFEDDRLGYGGASFLDARYQPVPPEALGSDGISPIPSESNPGVGGYFSPRRFTSRGVRVEARGRPRPTVDYSASAFLGTQSFTGVSGRRAGGLAAGLTFRLGERLSLPVAYTWDDFGPFAQQGLAARLVVLF